MLCVLVRSMSAEGYGGTNEQYSRSYFQVFLPQVLVISDTVTDSLYL